MSYVRSRLVWCALDPWIGNSHNPCNEPTPLNPCPHPYSITLISNILLPRPNETGCRIHVRIHILRQQATWHALASAHILYQYVHHVILWWARSSQQPTTSFATVWYLSKGEKGDAQGGAASVPSCLHPVSLPRRISSILYKVLIGTQVFVPERKRGPPIHCTPHAYSSIPGFFRFSRDSTSGSCG